ncbi:L,D-transpeptidase family protein [Rhodocytophaga aerolata]|uniref:L,D-transpeptidase family protein n=1 Tax=Rhodocytophaga aerolata TaxID=455078 RepID=A0ABT8RHN6_9BACT|nr:L,D-transpeptidase family protein [Rhodocytophaga aerolata]MDO1451504.1 L,D-transpeptidase family protein [Rhodocytophaga aerolata]
MASSSDQISFSDENKPDQVYAITAYQDLLQSIICEGLDTALVPAYFITDNVRSYAYQSFIDFYRHRECKPAWNNLQGPLPQADSLIAVLQAAPEEGLLYTYFLDKLTQAEQEVIESLSGTTWPDSVQLAKIAHFDFLLTGSYLTYASHLLSGKVDPDQFDVTWIAHPRKRNLAPLLEQAISTKNIKASLEQVLPAFPQYAALKQALAQYTAIAQKGGWPSLPEDKILQLGDTADMIATLRQRLTLTNDLRTSTGTTDGNIFNEELAEAVKKYQHRNGLKADGIAGKNTIAQMNISVEKRLEQIQVNLERLRWMPDTLGKQYVLVNIPEYKLRVVEERQQVLEMKVIVGREYHSTPVFRDSIEYIEFSPTWTVPLSIARNEILPMLKKDSSYLEKDGFIVYENWHSDSSQLNPYQIKWRKIKPENFTYRLVQPPGPSNPLGQVKFMFPNPLAIYLHDTPSQRLFNKKNRAFSHGCVRVSKPVALARYLLKDLANWDEQRIEKNMNRQEPKVVSLPETIPVQFIYQTAFVDEDNLVNFRKDVYGHDSLQITTIQ